MTDNPTTPRTRHRRHGPLLVTLLAVALTTLGCGASESSESSESSGRTPDSLAHPRTAGDHQPADHQPGDHQPGDHQPGDHQPRGARGGPFDLSQPTIGNLDPDLLDAIQAAARAAQDDGVRMVVTSGWRSRTHQERLFEEAVSKYGSEEEASRYVATPDTSAHVTGDAVDIGPTDADSWLSQHGADYGLCQTFANEIWHYELATTPGGQCPDMLPDGSGRG